MIDAAAHRALVPRVHDVEHERRVHRNRRMQAARRLPGAIADAGDELADRPGRMQRHAPAVAGDDVARVGHAGHLHLQPFDRGIHVAHRAAAARFFAQHVPRLERLTQFEVHAPARDGPEQRKPEFEVRREPLGLERVPAAPQVGDDIVEILRDEMRQHEAVVQLRAPADERLIERRLPEPRDERAQQQLLRQAHARVRRHLEGAQLHQPQPAAAAVGGVELVDAELGAVRVAGDVDQQIAEDAVHQPRRRAACARRLARTRSPVRRANRCALRPRADAGWSGR